MEGNGIGLFDLKGEQGVIDATTNEHRMSSSIPELNIIFQGLTLQY